MDDYSVAVDVGGTFTDIVLCNLVTNEQRVHKTPSTPDDPSTGFLTGLRELKGSCGPAVRWLPGIRIASCSVPFSGGYVILRGV